MKVATGSFIDKNYLTSEIVYMNCEQNKTNRNQIVTFKFTFEDKGFKNFKNFKNHFKLIFLKPNLLNTVMNGSYPNQKIRSVQWHTLSFQE